MTSILNESFSGMTRTTSFNRLANAPQVVHENSSNFAKNFSSSTSPQYDASKAMTRNMSNRGLGASSALNHSQPAADAPVRRTSLTANQSNLGAGASSALDHSKPITTQQTGSMTRNMSNRGLGASAALDSSQAGCALESPKRRTSLLANQSNLGVGASSVLDHNHPAPRPSTTSGMTRNMSHRSVAPNILDHSQPATNQIPANSTSRNASNKGTGAGAALDHSSQSLIRPSTASGSSRNASNKGDGASAALNHNATPAANKGVAKTPKGESMFGRIANLFKKSSDNIR